MLRFNQIRAGDHHFDTAHVDSSLNDSIEVIFVSLFIMIDAPKYRIAQIDTHLHIVSYVVACYVKDALC